MKKLNKLTAELITLRERIAQRPIRVPVRGGSAAPYTTIQIGGGNAFTTGQFGIQFVTAPPVVPSQFWTAAAMLNTMDSGLGWGYRFVNGVQQQDLVLIYNVLPGVAYALLSGRRMRGAGTVTLTAPSDSMHRSMTFWTLDWG